MTFHIEKVIETIKNLGYQNINNLNILKKQNILFDRFILLLKEHKIYKFLIKEQKQNNIKFKINEDFIKEIIDSIIQNMKIRDLDKKLLEKSIINITKNKYKNKIKKLKRFLKIFYIKNTKNNLSKKQIYIIKLKLGYITMYKFQKNLIDYIIENNLYILYFDEIYHITEFLNSKFSIKNIPKKEIFIFIKNTITEIYTLFNTEKNNNIIVFELSDTINYIKRSLDKYITKYNTGIDIFERFPYFTNFKGNSDYGYYYLDEYRALEWDMIYNNRDLSHNLLEILKRIDKNTKYNSLISLYNRDNLPNQINKEELRHVIEDYCNNKINTTMDYIHRLHLLNIPSDIIVEMCQAYYTYSLVFEIYRKIFIDKLIYNQKIKKIIIIQNLWKQIYYSPKTIIGKKRLDKEMTELFAK